MSANVKPLFPPDALCSVSASRGGVTLTIEGRMSVAAAYLLLTRWATVEGVSGAISVRFHTQATHARDP
jgi:hypothetical protein